jgi:mono/diheme cytochrome c family protein
MYGTLVPLILAVGLVAVAASPVPRRQRHQQTPSLILDSITGRDSFEFYCASCHGITGKGDGPVANVLKTPPADLTSLARRNGGEIPKDRVLVVLTGTGRPVPSHGSTDMPVWGPIFRALDPSAPRVRLRIDNIVEYIATLQEPSTGPNDLGARLFRMHCAPCHGATGRGNGPLAEHLRRAPTDLTTYTERNSGIFPSERVARIIDGRDVPSHGDREMPVWGDAFRSAPEGLPADAVKPRIDAITRYLAGIQRRSAN